MSLSQNFSMQSHDTIMANQDDNDILDDVIGLEEDYGLFFPNFDSEMGLPELTEQLTEPPLVLSQNLQPTFDSTSSASKDIPVDRNEWFVLDRRSKRLRPPLAYEFLILLLRNPAYTTYASYKDKSQGLFFIHEPDKVANLWQQVKNRQANQPMTYENFARALRCYYKHDIMRKTNTCHTFQFSPRIVNQFIAEEHNDGLTSYS